MPLLYSGIQQLNDASDFLKHPQDWVQVQHTLQLLVEVKGNF